MFIQKSTYQKPFFIGGAHIETVIPNIFRKVKVTPTNTERIITPDDDFLDLDWHKAGSDSLVIVSHGLEGSSESQYVAGMAKYFNKKNIDVLGWNYRGCSGEMNLTTKFYHSGATYDLETIVKHSIGKGYTKIVLVGFSLGGNLTLKFLGEAPGKYSQVCCGVAFSVPLDLSSSCTEISKFKNKLYAIRFLKRLKKKIRAKHKLMGDKFPLNGIDGITDLRTFDNVFTGPLHGFKNAEDYYAKSSALFYLDKIEIPTLIVNSLNDPFLPAECYPIQKLKDHKQVWFETPNHGGHVGFGSAAKDGSYWSERRAYEFIKEYM
ncbi:MAG: alpha/beta fold hydrolase [Cyclobacteriaceae bacterium]|nr:alpha/beta fold hydrolase [Cyclobacteriaceae bacterium]